MSELKESLNRSCMLYGCRNHFVENLMLLSDSFLGMVHYVNSKLGSSLQNGNKYNGSPEIEYAAVPPALQAHLYQKPLHHISSKYNCSMFHSP